ncbi:hypothetical protein NQZ68_033065 [Dissostichus eleginoides]|nr:hypothetical protein NQZ68_033065 [Dissostichus eleginoides]
MLSGLALLLLVCVHMRVQGKPRSQRFIFPLHIHRLLVGLDFPPSGGLSLSWDYEDVLGTLLGIDGRPELARGSAAETISED